MCTIFPCCIIFDIHHVLVNKNDYNLPVHSAQIIKPVAKTHILGLYFKLSVKHRPTGELLSTETKTQIFVREAAPFHRVHKSTKLNMNRTG